MSEEARYRLFSALEVREPARAALERAVEPLRESHLGLRWTVPDMWHVTVAFVGSVPVERAPAVDAAAHRAAEGADGPIDVRLTGRFESFPGGVLYAAIEKTESLMALAARVAEALAAEGFAIDTSDYVPHCTIARVPGGARLAPQLLAEHAGPAVRWTARRLVVVRSRLKVGGAVHEIRSAHPLTAPSVRDGVDA